MTFCLRKYYPMLLLLLLLGGASCAPPPSPSGDGDASHGAKPPSYPFGFEPFWKQEGKTTEAIDHPTQTVKVGLLLPLSGPSAELGKALRDAAVLALFDKYASISDSSEGATRVELITRDTMGSPDGAEKAAKEVIAKGAKLIIGPLFSSSADAVRSVIKPLKINMITFSNNASIAAPGVFLFGFTPEDQAKRIADYSYLSRIDRVASLAPNTPYGRRVVAAVKKRSAVMGQVLEPSIFYSQAGGTMHMHVRELVTKGSVGARINFQALFLPESGDQLNAILRHLKNANVTPANVRFLGTGVWDDEKVINNPGLNGAWFASSPPQMYRAFKERFVHTYSYTPPRIASLAYDAVALAATLATSQAGFSVQALTDPSGYRGPANGIFRFTKSGHVERGLAVIEVMNGKRRVIDPAPVSFKKAQ